MDVSKDDAASTREQKRQELRGRLKAMQQARTGKTPLSNAAASPEESATKNLSKKEKRKLQKKVVKSSHVDELLKSFNIHDEASKRNLQKAIQDGRIQNMEDLAKFLSTRTKEPITVDDLLIKSSANPEHSSAEEDNWLRQATNDAADIMSLNPKAVQQQMPTSTSSDESASGPVGKQMRKPMHPPVQKLNAETTAVITPDDPD